MRRFVSSDGFNSPQCNHCKKLNRENHRRIMQCTEFPDGIPDTIEDGKQKCRDFEYEYDDEGCE